MWPIINMIFETGDFTLVDIKKDIKYMQVWKINNLKC